MQTSEIIVGLVYDPTAPRVFQSGSEDKAPRSTAQPIQISAVTELDKALLATGFPYDHRENADFYLSFFKAFMTRCQGIRRNGSAALDLCYVACGRLDGFWELELKPWDIAAGALIVAEAGGMAQRFFRRIIFYLGQRNARFQWQSFTMRWSTSASAVAMRALTDSHPSDRKNLLAPVVKRISRGSPEP